MGTAMQKRRFHLLHTGFIGLWGCGQVGHQGLYFHAMWLSCPLKVQLLRLAANNGPLCCSYNIMAQLRVSTASSTVSHQPCIS